MMQVASRLKDRALLELLAIFTIYTVPTFLTSGKGLWSFDGGGEFSVAPFLISIVSAVVLFKNRMGESFALPLRVSRP